MATRLVRALVVLMVGASVAPATAAAGGWATVGVEPMPDGTRAGESWTVSLTVLQHGRTPLVGVRPTLTVRRADVARTFRAVPTAEPGVYRARVVFPSAGEWRYVVDDDFSAKHRFGPVSIGEGPAAAASAGRAGDDDGGSGLGIGLVAALVAAALAGTVLLWSRGRRRAGPAAG